MEENRLQKFLAFNRYKALSSAPTKQKAQKPSTRNRKLRIQHSSIFPPIKILEEQPACLTIRHKASWNTQPKQLENIKMVLLLLFIVSDIYFTSYKNPGPLIFIRFMLRNFTWSLPFICNFNLGLQFACVDQKSISQLSLKTDTELCLTIDSLKSEL